MKPSYETVRNRLIEKKIARERLKYSAVHAKNRFSPRNLLREGKQKLDDVTDAVIDEGVGAVVRYKWPLAGITAAIGLYMARKPIYRWARKLRSKTQDIHDNF